MTKMGLRQTRIIDCFINECSERKIERITVVSEHRYVKEGTKVTIDPDLYW